MYGLCCPLPVKLQTPHSPFFSLALHIHRSRHYHKPSVWLHALSTWFSPHTSPAVCRHRCLSCPALASPALARPSALAPPSAIATSALAQPGVLLLLPCPFLPAAPFPLPPSPFTLLFSLLSAPYSFLFKFLLYAECRTQFGFNWCLTALIRCGRVFLARS